MKQLLTAMGYEDVSLSTRSDSKGKHLDGGLDIRAFKWVPGGRRSVIIQAKQYRPSRLIYRKFLDELRGVALRENAAEAMLITTSGFSESLSESAFAAAPIAPVRLIDVVELTELMALFRVGVIKEPAQGDISQSWYFLDDDFFKSLQSVNKPLRNSVTTYV